MSMSKIKKGHDMGNNKSNPEPENQDISIGFKEKIKRHLSNEYVYTMEKKDELENLLVQLKMEKSQINRTLFPNIEHKNVRKYFSPLTIKEEDTKSDDKRNSDLDREIARVQEEIKETETILKEIKDFLYNIDSIFYSVAKDSSSEESYPQNGDNFPKTVDFFTQGRNIYPQMLRNLYEFADYLRKEFKEIEVLIEFNDNNIETKEEVNENLLKQINDNIISIITYYDILSILIQGEVTSKSINISIHYLCEDKAINEISVRYCIDYS